MKTKTIVSSIVLLLGVSGIIHAAPVNNAFTYQGKLTSSGAAATGVYDMKFTLYDTNITGSVISGPITNAAIGVTNGYFAVMLDFGAAFDGTARWLEIGVRTNGGVVFATLNPRQPLTAAPYALYAPNAGAATTAFFASVATNANSVAAANVTGTLAPTQLPAGIVTNNASGLTLSGTFSGNGARVTNVNLQNVSS